jgi:hypothetical protein
MKEAIPTYNSRQISCKEISVVLSRQAEIPTYPMSIPYVVSNMALHRKLFHACRHISITKVFGGWQIAGVALSCIS